MKTPRFLLLAGVSLATTLILSCGLKDSLEEIGNNITQGLLSSNNLLQNDRLANGLMDGNGARVGVPTGDVNAIQSVDVGGNAINGGSTLVKITSSEPLAELYIQIEGEENSYYVWEIEDEDLLSSPNEDSPYYVYGITLEFNRSLGEGDEGTSPNIIISGKTVSGDKVNKEEVPLEVKVVNNGVLQVSLSWDQLDDVDLYVFNPNGDKLYWNNESANNNNDSLDLDANRGCATSGPDSKNWGVNNENVYFKEPLKEGKYTVIVSLYKKCYENKPGAIYNVTANLKGKFVEFSSKQKGQFEDETTGIFNPNLGQNGGAYPIYINTPEDANIKVIGIIEIDENGNLVEEAL